MYKLTVNLNINKMTQVLSRVLMDSNTISLYHYNLFKQSGIIWINNCPGVRKIYVKKQCMINSVRCCKEINKTHFSFL